MVAQTPARLIHLFFFIGVIVKGIDGVLELIGGVLLVLVSPDHVHHIVRMLTQHELIEDPRDLIANYLLSITHHLSLGTETFAALYLLGHGVVKAGLVAALLLRKRWAYPIAILAFFLFMVYQLYRYADTAAPSLLLLSMLDAFVIVLTWLEYRRLRSTPGLWRIMGPGRSGSINR